MHQFGRRGVGYTSDGNTDSVQSPLSVTPQVTWTAITYNCPKHPTMGYQFAMEDIVKINQYPHNSVVFRSQDNKG